MIKVKLCGLSRESDIAAVNKLKPDLVGFVFAKKSKRYVSPEQAAALKSLLAPGILAAGVFVNEPVEAVAELLDRGIIDVAQLHGSEDDDYIARLRAMTERSGARPTIFVLEPPMSMPKITPIVMLRFFRKSLYHRGQSA